MIAKDTDLALLRGHWHCGFVLHWTFEFPGRDEPMMTRCTHYTRQEARDCPNRPRRKAKS